MKREAETTGWGNLYNEELHLYFSPDVRVIKSWRIRWTRQVACVGGKRNACRVQVEKPKGKGQSGGL